MRQTVNASNSECVKQWSHAHWHDTDAISMQPSGDCVRHRRSTCQPAKSAYKSRPDFDGGKVTNIFRLICEYIRLVVTTLIIQVHKRHLIERMTMYKPLHWHRRASAIYSAQLRRPDVRQKSSGVVVDASGPSSLSVQLCCLQSATGHAAFVPCRPQK